MAVLQLGQSLNYAILASGGIRFLKIEELFSDSDPKLLRVLEIPNNLLYALNLQITRNFILLTMPY